MFLPYMLILYIPQNMGVFLCGTLDRFEIFNNDDKNAINDLVTSKKYPNGYIGFARTEDVNNV
jgi:hypothetical protein